MSPVSIPFPVPVRWSPNGRGVLLLDQTLLPDEERYLTLNRVEEMAEAISSLRVRGAPAIGIAAAMGLAVEMRCRLEDGEGGLDAAFARARAMLLATRPTAVNLSWAMSRMTRAFDGTAGGEGRARVGALVAEAEAIAHEDREMGRRIGGHGLGVLPEEGATLLTHCNAGALATGGTGTALAPIYAAHGRGIPVKVFADETRPLLQGARLTAWELKRAGVDITVICDGMAAALMARGGVDLVVVGADRVAANGDVANKIGTYGLAVLAQHHGIPFYVALPRTTFDLSLGAGESIPIEERDSSEIEFAGGHRVVPEGVPCWNPAFDVTPAHLVTAFITDGGLLRPPFRVTIRRLLDGPASDDRPSPAAGGKGSGSAEVMEEDS